MKPASIKLYSSEMSENQTVHCDRRTVQRVDLSEVIAALAALDRRRADDYNEWFKIGCALHSLGEHYFVLFDMWSRQSPRYGKTREIWNAMVPMENGIGIGTLFYLAQLDGWQPQQQDGSSDGKTFHVLTSHDLNSGDFKVDYLIDDILVAGQPAICGGVSKTLKTSICVDAAIALASGTPYLGHFQVLEKQRTLIMSGESGLGTLQETAQRICASRGLDLGTLTDLLWTEELPQCDSDKDLAKLGHTIDTYNVGVLFIDPAYLCLGGDDHADIFKQGQLLRRLNKLIADSGVTVVLVHHNKKSVAKSKTAPQLEDLAMAGFAEFARQWELLGRREPFCSGQPHKLWLNAGGSAGHSGLYCVDINEGSRKDKGGRRWEVKVTDHYAEQDNRANADVLVIREALTKTDGLTFNAITKRTGLVKKRVETALQSPEFVESMILHPQSKDKKIRGYRLKKDVA